MYLLDVALHNLACLAKKGMLLIQERFHLFLPFVSSWEALSLQRYTSHTETEQLLACDYIEIVF